ncbi:MAG: ABC-2 family transporter protein [Verrucomicrobiota bacterium]|jgi:ABC-2 type transport system permease protein
MAPNPNPSSFAERVRRHAAIYVALWRNSVVREMSFKSNFLLWIFVEFLWFGLQLSFIGVIYLHTDHIASWSKWQVVMLVGASHFIQQIFQAFFLTNCVQLSELIRTGRLDFMMLLPMNTRFLISLRQVDLGEFVNAASALGVIAYAARQLHFVPDAAQIAGFLMLCVAGILIHYSLMFLLASVAFWTVRAQGIVWGYYSLFNIARSPDAAFQGFFRAFFTFAIPMLLVANVPVKLLLRLASPGEMLWLLGMVVICFVASELFWRFSMRHYASASA